MQTTKGNPVPNVTNAVIQPEDALRRVVQLGKATYTAALDLCWSAAVFMLLVNHFKDAKDKGYMSKSDATEYMEKRLREETGVQNRILANYTSVASQIAGTLTGSSKMFSATIQRIGLSETPEDAAAILAKWYEGAKGRKIASMRSLMEALGESKVKKTRAVAATPAQAIERVGNAITKIEESMVGKGNGKVAERALIVAVAEKVKSQITLAIEAIKRLTNMAELDTIIQAAQSQKQELVKLTKQANEEVKARADQHAGTKKRNAAFLKSKGKSKTVQTSA